MATTTTSSATGPARHAGRPRRRLRPGAASPAPRSPPTRSRAFGDGGFADAEAALAAYDDAVDGRRRRASGAKADARLRRRRRGAHRERRAGPGQGAARRGPQAAARRATTCSTAVHAAVEQFAASSPAMGGLMAERVTDLRDIERRLVARLVGEPEPGVPDARRSRRCWSPRTSRRPTPRASTPRWSSRWSPSAAARPATPRSSPASSASPAWSASPARIDARRGHAGARRRHDRRRSRSTPTPTRPTRGWRPDRERARTRWTRGPARRAPPTARRSSCWPTSPTARRPRTAGARRRSRASGCSAPSCASSTARTSRRVEEQADIYARRARALRRRTAYVVVRTLDAGSDKPIAFATHEGEENPALGVRGLRLSFGNPGLLERQLDGDRARPPSAPAPRPG